MTPFRHIARYTLVTLLIGLSLWAISLAVRWGTANLYNLKVQHYLERWSDASRGDQTTRGTGSAADGIIAPQQMELDDALNAARIATSRHPQHPHYWSLLAQVHEWRGLATKTNSTQEFRQAAAAYHQSIALRPLWPDARVRLLLHRWREGKVDALLFQLLHTADQTGPFTPLVHIGISDAGLGLWQQLPPNSRKLVLTHLLRGMQNPHTRHQIWQLAQRHQQQAIFCLIANTQLATSHPVQQWCH